MNLYPLGHLILVILELLLLVFAYPFFRISKNWAMIILPIVLFSTIYDNFILWSGQFIGEGQLLENLSQIRFLLHYLIVPLFIVVAIELAHFSGAKWANNFIRISSWLLAFLLAGYDTFNNFMGLQLNPDIFANVVRYVPVNAQIPVITILINIFVLLVGIGIWIRTKNWQWLFIGSLVSLVGNGIPSAEVGTLPGSASEFFLALALLLTQYHFEDNIDDSAPVTSTCPEGWICHEYEGYQLFEKQESEYIIYQTGSHQQGNFVRVYAPNQPYRENNKLKVITYLHGFALCLPKFYEEHLQELVKQGYYVFFPDYQKSDYPNFVEDKHTYLDHTSGRVNTKYWLFNLGLLLINVIFKRKIRQQKLQKFSEQGIWKSIKLILGSLLFVLGVNLIYFFDRQYAKNLISMITTVIESLTDTPIKWLDFAFNSTVQGWEKLLQHTQKYPHQNCNLSEEEIDFYVFGHSLGGLLALSWCYYLAENPSPTLELFKPKQVITSDPAPSTALGIPAIALWILNIFRFPFATQSLTIENTGKKLDVPVGILHGNDDGIVKPTEWIKPPLSNNQGAFFTIASENKKIYFSLSNKSKNLVADHNQSVTDTTYYGDGFMTNFGGAKEKPNAYNFQYVWSALNAIVKNEVQADKLSNHQGFNLEDFEVVDEPTKI